jgi:ABC-2 type transport system ATP-binding protein
VTGSAIDIQGLTRRFGKHVALDQIDLRVPEGSIFGFLGPNGAGKTTTIRILTGLIPPTSGVARVFGEDVTEGSAQTRGLIGFLPDVPAFYPWMTAPEFLRFAGLLFSLDEATLEERVPTLLDMAGLAGVRTKVGGFSRGMKQRLGIAQALINTPRLLLLDEPTSALDPMGRKEVLDLIASLKGRATVFFSSHILADIERVCDEVAILNRGRVVTQAPVEQLKTRRRGNVIAVEIVGDPTPMLDALAGEGWLTRVERSDGVMRFSVSDVSLAQREIPRAIAAAGLELKRFEPGEVTLEEVFVELVGSGQ